MDKSNRLGTVPGNENLPRSILVVQFGNSRRPLAERLEEVPVSTEQQSRGSCERRKVTGKASVVNSRLGTPLWLQVQIGSASLLDVVTGRVACLDEWSS